MKIEKKLNSFQKNRNSAIKQPQELKKQRKSKKRKKQQQGYQSKKPQKIKVRGQNVIGNLTNNFMTQLKKIQAPFNLNLTTQNETEKQTLYSQLKRVKVFKKKQKQITNIKSKAKIFQQSSQNIQHKYFQNRPLFPISATVSSNIVNFIIVVYYYWKQFENEKEDIHHEIVQSIIKKVKFNLIEYIFTKHEIKKKRQDVLMRKKLFFFYCQLQENLIDIEKNPEKIIESLIKVAFRDKNKKSDIEFCQNQILTLLQKVRNNQFEGLFIESQVLQRSHLQKQTQKIQSGLQFQ